LLNVARVNRDFSLPLSLQNYQDFPILQYVDNTLIFLQGNDDQFGAKSIGLKVNIDKSFMVPISVLEDKF
jgi:hypothetical protein